MAENNKTKETQSSKDRIGYGVKIPLLTFPECIKSIKEIAIKGGLEGNDDVLSQVFGNSASSSTLLNKIYALRGFGLLTFQAKQYSFTDIGKNIVQPESEEMEKENIVRSFATNSLLSTAWENYKGKLLPQREYLSHFFEKNLSIPADLKLNWADYFLEAAKFAGLVFEKDNGSFQMLSAPIKSPTQLKIPEEKPSGEEKYIPQGQKPTTDNLSSFLSSQYWGILNQRKISNDRKAIFAIPDELTQDDIEMLRVIIKGIDASLDGLKKYEPK